ncbi:uncharacterized protein LOC144877013 isoform X1 [Branchiostoma floridae x Branchiostoma japonicum]
MDSRARRTSETHDVREARLLGEVCHQLEQRVLVSVFPRQKIDPASFSLRTIGDLVRLERDPDEKEFLTRKLGRVTATLRLYGFDFQRHPFFMTDVMLRFGKFPTDWDKYNFVHQKGYHDPDLLREVVGRPVPVTIVTRVLSPGYHSNLCSVPQVTMTRIFSGRRWAGWCPNPSGTTCWWCWTVCWQWRGRTGVLSSSGDNNNNKNNDNKHNNNNWPWRRTMAVLSSFGDNNNNNDKHNNNNNNINNWP